LCPPGALSVDGVVVHSVFDPMSESIIIESL